MIKTIFALLLTLAGLHAVADTITPKLDSCLEPIPQTLRTALIIKYSQWKVVHLADLDDDDQRLWTAKYQNICPGVTSGNFDGSKRVQFALLLVNSSKKRILLLYAVSDEDGQYRINKILEDRVDRLSVVYRAPQGIYQAVEDDSSVRTDHDVIVLETIEAGSIVFYLRNGKFQRKIVSD